MIETQVFFARVPIAAPVLPRCRALSRAPPLEQSKVISGTHQSQIEGPLGSETEL